MKNKLFLFLSLTVLVSVLVGLTIGDPWGSKTQTTDNIINVNTPPHVSYGTVVYVDSLNGVNDTTALKERGYKPYYRGTGAQGTIATWYQGQIAVFNAYNGPSTGYVAANYSVVTGANNIDSWLVLPRVAGGLLATDSLIFYERSATGSIYPDSVRVMYSANDSIPEGSWTELGRFKTNTTTGWQRQAFKAAAASVNGRFAIRYCVVNGGPSGTNSDYIGIDAITIERSGSGPTATFYSSQWCAAATFPPVPSATYFQASAWLGDTLYVATPTTAGAGANTIIRYKLGGSWTTGVPMPGTKVGGTLTACNGKLYYVGGGTASILTPDAAVYEYTPSTGTWATKAPLPVALAGHGAGNWGDSVIFVVGGPYSGPTGNVYVYNVPTNTWRTSTAMPTGGARRTFAFGISGNQLFVGAGYSTAFMKTFFVGTIGSNASTITWVQKADVPIPPAWTGLSRPGGVAFMDRFYVIGGERGGPGGYRDSVNIWNITLQTWQTVIIGKPGGGMSNICNAPAARKVNDTVKVFIPGGYGLVGGVAGASTNFDVIGCGPTLTGIAPSIMTPETYSLSQNYPNPFNPVTKINFALPKSGLVTLKVYDVLGKEITTLVNEVKNVGAYTVDFNGSNLSSGVYFYKLSSGDFTSIKRMMLIK